MMSLSKAIRISAVFIVTPSGCGSGGSSSSYLIGDRLGAAVYMQPGLLPYSFRPWSGTAPGIRIDEVAQFSSTVHPGGTGIYQATSQVVFGQITGPVSGVQVVVYSETNTCYIQPLTSTTIHINTPPSRNPSRYFCEMASGLRSHQNRLHLVLSEIFLFLPLARYLPVINYEQTLGPGSGVSFRWNERKER